MCVIAEGSHLCVSNHLASLHAALPDPGPLVYKRGNHLNLTFGPVAPAGYVHATCMYIKATPLAPLSSLAGLGCTCRRMHGCIIIIIHV